MGRCTLYKDRVPLFIATGSRCIVLVFSRKALYLKPDTLVKVCTDIFILVLILEVNPARYTEEDFLQSKILGGRFVEDVIRDPLGGVASWT